MNVTTSTSAALVDDSAIELVEYEELPYPAVAKEARISGIVVVEAKLDDSGQVTDAHAIYAAHLMLNNAAVSCVKRWKFKPNSEHLAFAVADFRVAEGTGCKQIPRFQSVLQPPNHALILGYTCREDDLPY
jgi:TonB family protein